MRMVCENGTANMALIVQLGIDSLDVAKPWYAYIIRIYADKRSRKGRACEAIHTAPFDRFLSVSSVKLDRFLGPVASKWKKRAKKSRLNAGFPHCTLSTDWRLFFLCAGRIRCEAQHCTACMQTHTYTHARNELCRSLFFVTLDIPELDIGTRVTNLFNPNSNWIIYCFDQHPIPDWVWLKSVCRNDVFSIKNTSNPTHEQSSLAQ